MSRRDLDMQRLDDEAAALLSRATPFPESDELSQERVWRAVAKTLPSRPVRAARWVWVAVACGLAVVATGLIVRLSAGGPPPSRFELTAGSVLAAAPGGSWAPAEAGTLFGPSSRVKTDNRARALLRLARAEVLVAPGTDAALESTGVTTFLRLSNGELVAQVDPRKPGESFVIQTTRYRVTVKGTIFAVRERAADDVTVSVSRGLVEVSGEGGTWDVPAGRSWNSRTPDAMAVDDIPARDRALVDSAGTPGPRSALRVEGAPELEVSEGGVVLGPPPITWSAPVGRYHFVGTSAERSAEGDATASAGLPATVRLTLPPQAVGGEATHAAEAIAERTPVEAPAPAPPVAVEPSRPARVHHVHTFVPHHVRSEPPSPAAPVAAVPQAHVDETPAIPEPAPSRPLYARLDTPAAPKPVVTQAPRPLDFKQAVRLARDGQYEDAARALEGIAAGHGPDADMALYELGQLQQLHLGRPDAALAAYLRYEKDYPRGMYGQEVRLSALELELQRKDFGAALTQMNGFLERFPASERSPEVHLLRGNVLRERGDCKAALEDYRRASGSAHADDALYFEAWCQQNLGHRDDAETSFRAYLTQFPNGRHAAQARETLGGP